MTEKVLYEKRGPIAYITLNRPEVKNAIDLGVLPLSPKVGHDLAQIGMVG